MHGGTADPFDGFIEILASALPLGIHDPQIVFCIWKMLDRRFTVPLESFQIVLFDTVSLIAKHATGNFARERIRGWPIA